MEDTYAIEVDHISKHFKIFLDKGHELKDYVTSVRRAKYENRQVLKDISFKVKKGEAIGLIGQNGCGKSTTLKLLTKIMYPDSGSITMRGRVSSLIELGAGFHPDMSGRENIYINASIFGLSKKEIDRRLDDIIAFSELEEFIDNPVRTYSSGMYMRLAFAVAINVDADILLIDEILAVGDVNFQEKCFERLREIKAMGTTIVIVSHSLGQIEKICNRSLWIDDGRIRDEGIPKYVHEQYLNAMEAVRLGKLNAHKPANENAETEKGKDNKINKANRNIAEDKVKENTEINIEKNTAIKATENLSEEKNLMENTVERLEEDKTETKVNSNPNGLPPFCSPLSIRIGSRVIEFTDVKLMDSNGVEKRVFKTGEAFCVQMDYRSNMEGLKVNFGIGIFRDDGVHIYGTNTDIERNTFIEVNKTGRVSIIVENNCLLPAKYMLDVAMHSPDGIKYDDIRNVVPFNIGANKRDIGVCRLENTWIVDGIYL